MRVKIGYSHALYDFVRLMEIITMRDTGTVSILTGRHPACGDVAVIFGEEGGAIVGLASLDSLRPILVRH